MKKSILLVLTLLFFVVSFTASVNADIMSWTDRQSLNDNLESRPVGDEDPWGEQQSINPNENNGGDELDPAMVSVIVGIPSNCISALVSIFVDSYRVISDFHIQFTKYQ